MLRFNEGMTIILELTVASELFRALLGFTILTRMISIHVVTNVRHMAKG